MKLDIKNYPLILKLICGIVLLPILAAPLVFYSTIFFFDNPSSEGEAFCWFLAVNSYSLILLGICWASVWLYSKIRKADLASLPFLFYLILILSDIGILQTVQLIKIVLLQVITGCIEIPL